jgi:hypothetical protein
MKRGIGSARLVWSLVVLVLAGLVVAASRGPQVHSGQQLKGAGVTVAIAVPTSDSTYDAGTSATIAISGTASSNSPVLSCSWSNNVGGSGSATGTTAWSIASVDLTVGTNVITVTCVGNGGGSGSDVITVTRSAEQSVIGLGIAKGCTTAYYIDWDCDGYGPGVRSNGVYGWDALGVGDMPDADDTVASINTTATVAAAYGSGGTLTNAQLKTFLATRGYTVQDVFYVSTTGSNTTGTVNNPNLPFATYDGRLYSELTAGDAVVYRGGNYIEPDIGGGAPSMKDGTAGNPIIVMSYPGENVKLLTSNTNSFNTTGFGADPGTDYNIIDGFIVDHTAAYGGAGALGLGNGFGCSGATHTTIRNIEATRFKYITCVNGHSNLTVERSIFHHQQEHGLYAGANLNASTDIVIQDNIFYANGYSYDTFRLSAEYGGHQFNGRCTSGCMWERNIAHSNGSWGLSLIQGVKNATIQNNLIFNNAGYGVIINMYTPPNSCAAFPGQADEGICPYDSSGNVFENNTVFVGTTRADGESGSGVFPAPFAAFGIARTEPGCVEAGVSVATENCQAWQIFRNNVIYVYNGAAFQFYSKTTTETWPENSTFQNNIIYKLGSASHILCDDFYTSSTNCNSNSVGESGEAVYDFSAFNSTFGGGANLNNDPLLVRANTADYGAPEVFNLRPQVFSPTRQAGTSTGIPTLDIKQNTRSGPHDIGAYEFVYPTIEWTTPTVNAGSSIQPGWTAQIDLPYDPVSGKIFLYAARSTSSIIYSTDMFAWDTTDQNFTWFGGTGSPVSDADYDGSRSIKQPWPGDRHPNHGLIYDSLRSVMWLVGGFSSTCSTCQDIAYGGTMAFWDTWKLSLNADVSSNTWTMLCGTYDSGYPSFKCPTTTSAFPIYGALVHDPVSDVLIMSGSYPSGFWKTWILCPTPVGGGGITAAQTAAGCTSLNAWTDLSSVVTGAVPGPEPDYIAFNKAYWDSNRARVVHMLSGSNGFRNVVEYSVTAKSYTNRSPSGMPSESSSGFSPEQPWAQITTGTWQGGYLYTKTSHHNTTCTDGGSWFYDGYLNVAVSLSQTGSGPCRYTFNGWDADQELVVANPFAAGILHGELK